MDIYEPSEDSYLLQKWVKKYAKRAVLDVGTGSGIQALTAANKKSVSKVVAVDINGTAIANLKKKVNDERITNLKPLVSNLFSSLQETFDCIIFNPPYLPQDKGIEDIAIYGGKKGWEISDIFFSQVSAHLKQNGFILYLFSSHTNLSKVHTIIANYGFIFEKLDELSLAFEKLFVYKISKSLLLKSLEKKGITHFHYFTKGKRGLIYRAILKDKKGDKIDVAIKVKNPASDAQKRIIHEQRTLKFLNKKNIGPTLLFTSKDYFVYRFAEGDFFPNFITSASLLDIQKVIFKILEQCYTLDLLHLNKEEMHRPLRHIIISNSSSVTLLDFERTSPSKKPKNVTQFLDYVGKISPQLFQRGYVVDRQKLRRVSQQYKKKEILFDDMLKTLP